MQATQAPNRLLLVDDDPDLLEVYREILAQLPSKPEIHTANSGARAIAMLDSEPYRLLISDLKMPKMDGLQVLSIVRRKFPQVRTVALTSVLDEQFRSRAYGLGIDMFWHKPGNEQEIQMFLECLESLLGREDTGGFRGIQSKSLVDIVQLECISQSSSVLRIINGSLTGKVWILDGEIIDSEADELRGEDAFRKILSWRAGHFETLPAEPSRPRTIFKSYNGLLLESAQALDESVSQNKGQDLSGPLAEVSRINGVEFVLVAPESQEQTTVARGLENPKALEEWAKRSVVNFRSLGERLQVGPVEHVCGLGIQRHIALVKEGESLFCVGWQHSMSPGQIRESMKRVTSLWAS
jgi:CheY-like chemotaxis protein